jgi:hypothetical protein
MALQVSSNAHELRSIGLSADPDLKASGVALQECFPEWSSCLFE